VAVREPKDLLSRLADAGEDAIQRLGDVPGAERLLGATQALRDRIDEMQKKMRGIDALEKRVAELERQVEELRGGSAHKTPSAARKTTTARKTSPATKRTSSTRKSSSS